MNQPTETAASELYVLSADAIKQKKRGQIIRLVLFGTPVFCLFDLYMVWHIFQNRDYAPLVLVIPLLIVIGFVTLVLGWGVWRVLRPYPEEKRILLRLDDEGMQCLVYLPDEDVLAGRVPRYFKYSDIARIFERIENNGGNGAWRVLWLEPYTGKAVRLILLDLPHPHSLILDKIAQRAGLSRIPDSKGLLRYERNSAAG
ncbi:hypothetical protein [Silvimonas iriomotensis]|uniref:Bacterial Pleckstrin homology domain-containing protein n=1 Tax=Silvimonas iriomotensis TaxID=449662 RepID=A0ABQ2PB05_9NEIS|nr:hypothetical protein [Silvimonas iriomotensis]GGP22488.1 hypothetical protein GCM10010970_25480 [Silvimonas iriomotensis]